MHNALNERIKELRIQRGWNQVDFAKSMNVTKQCVSNWENDNVLPSIEMLERIADCFCVSTDYLLGRDLNEYVDVTGLSPEEVSHIRMLVSDLRERSKK